MMTNSTKPKDTMDLVAMIESSRNQYALRFESAFVVGSSKTTLIKKYNRVTLSTAMVIGKTSWGMFQVMGVNVYHLGYQKQIGEYLCSLDDQKDIFKKYLIENGIDYSIEELKCSQAKRENFARRYNGSVLYAQRIEEFL